MGKIAARRSDLFPVSGDVENIEKVQKRATKLVISLNYLTLKDYDSSSLIPTLNYRRLQGDMIEVSKIIHDYYYTGASVKLHFNPVSTLGNTFKLRKDVSIMIRKYFFVTGSLIFGIICRIMW